MIESSSLAQYTLADADSRFESIRPYPNCRGIRGGCCRSNRAACWVGRCCCKLMLLPVMQQQQPQRLLRVGVLKGTKLFRGF